MAQNKKLRQSYEELQNAVSSLQEEVMGLRQAIGGNAEVLAAIVSILGEDMVQNEMARMRQERQDAQEAQMAAGIKMLVEANVLKPLAETALGALVVGTDTSADGKTRRVQFELNEKTVPYDLLPKFLAKKPGDTIENNGVKMTISEIYEIDKARAAEFQAEQTKKAQEAAAAAAQATQAQAAAPAAEVAAEPVAEAAPASDAPQA